MKERDSRGLTQERFADLVGISKRTLEKVEAGEAVSPTTMHQLAKCLGMPYHSLVQGVEPPSGAAPLEAADDVAKSACETNTCSPLVLPHRPSLVIGREHLIAELKDRLGVGSPRAILRGVQVLTAVRGWPGVGKTTVAAALVHDPEIAAHFGDGILWASLGQHPDVLSEMIAWGVALGAEQIAYSSEVASVSRELRRLLLNKRVLIVLDDVWEAGHVAPFLIGDDCSAVLVTTRETRLAHAVAGADKDILRVDVLSEPHGIELLNALAPEIVSATPDQCLQLVRALEALPLALRVAARLLKAEAVHGWGIDNLLADLIGQGTMLLATEAPADMSDIVRLTTPTVAGLLRRSADRLNPDVRLCFAALGSFAPTPATFGIRAMEAIWGISDGRPIVRELVDRGLLEPVGDSRYQMHALLVQYARTLLSD